MARFRSKPVEVEAEQWFPGTKIEGVEERRTEIHYSDDRKLFYVTRPGCAPRSWMSTEKMPGAIPDKHPDGGGIFSPQLARIATADQEAYHRAVFPFAFFSVSTKQRIVEPLDEGSELFKDYACLSDWPEKATPVAYAEPDRHRVDPGDWIVREPDHAGVRRIRVYKPEAFAAKYEAA